jgi:rod shape-determining protein MreC
METLITRYRNLTVLLLVIFAQLVLLAYQVKSNQETRLLRVWAVTAVTPLARVLEFVRENTIGVALNYLNLVNVRQENQQLEEQLGKLKLENQFLRTELQTAERVQALQAFQKRTPSRTIPARVIGTGTGANSMVVFVDQGSGAGVMRGMAVITPDGIVGKVLSAYPTASQVLLITDPTFAAGVISDKNRIHGTLKGTGRNKCIVDYVQNEEKVEVGEMFYTSGDDRIFPKGMPAGRVNVVREGKNGKEIYVVPAGFQHGLEEVLIVLEGVHQPIPEPATASSEIYIMPPPEQPADAGAKTADVPSDAGPAGLPGRANLLTDADRLKERYKKLGESQGHTFGEGGVGSRPPDFNANPEAAKPKPPAASSQRPAVTPGGAAAVGGSPPTNPPAAAKPKPDRPAADAPAQQPR